MATRRFEPFFCVELHHGKIDQPQFRLQPTQTCREVLDKLGWVFRQNRQAFTVAGPVASVTPPYRLQKQLTGQQLTLSFALFSDHPHFYRESNLPVETPGSFVYVVDNLDGTTERSAALNQPSGIGTQLRLPLAWNTIIVKEVSQQPPRLWDANGNEVSLAQRMVLHELHHHIDLTALQAGRYRLFDGNNHQDYYVCSAEFVRSAPVAVLDIYLHQEVDLDYQIIQYPEPQQSIQQSIQQTIQQKHWAIRFGRFADSA
ncbi:MAG: hypothetical protein HRT35_17860 [Algicola sp.]|nr:hypothetical protein [Algicola sp.]